jgi:co-chaperonin GroES (HSP10)
MKYEIGQLLGDRVLVKELDLTSERRTATGIIIPETVMADEAKLGTVIAVGNGLYTQNGVLIPMTVKVGDTVALPSFNNGQIIKLGDSEYTIYRESDILMVLSKEKNESSEDEPETSF